MFATNPSLMVVYCHVVIFAKTMEHNRDSEQEEMLGDIIRDGGGDITLLFLNDTNGEGRQDEDSGDRMGGGDDGSVGDEALTVAKPSEVYIY